MYRMKMSALVKRAREAGVASEDVDAAHDAPDLREALVSLIQELPGIQWGELGPPPLLTWRDQLHRMKFSALLRHAREAGVSAELIDGAHDEHDPKEALAQLIKARPVANTGTRGGPLAR